jgi:hypothetical protein
VVAMSGVRLESGPAQADRNWHLARAVLFLAFAGYFIYDGAIGYPNRIRTNAEEKLAAPTHFNGALRWEDLEDKPLKPDYDAMQATNPVSREQVVSLLGEPTLTKGSEVFFVSRYGYGKVTMMGTRVGKIDEWVSWYKTQAEVQGQFYWALLPGLIGLYFLWRLYKAVTLRVVLDDAGMVYAGQRIPYAQMVALRDYSPKGWIDLYYKDGETERKLRLDHEKVAKFDEIVELICQEKGFRNEVRIAREEKHRREADDAAAKAAEESEADADAARDE